MLAATGHSSPMNSWIMNKRVWHFLRAFCPSCCSEPDGHIMESFCCFERPRRNFQTTFSCHCWSKRPQRNKCQPALALLFIFHLWFTPAVLWEREHLKGEKKGPRLFRPRHRWCLCGAPVCLSELNKNRRKLFEPPIRSSFLEGGASGRLSRQFHADMASISGRW